MRPVTSAIRSAFRRLGYDIVRYDRYREMATRWPRHLNVLELAVRAHLPQEDRFFFIQIGANDGMRYDPMRDMVIRYHLAGLLVEPLKDMFEELRKNYASETRLLFENAAIGKEDGEQSIFRFASNAPVEDWFHGWATFDKGRMRGVAAKRGLEAYIQEVRVPTLTFKSLITKYQIENVTLLVVDTEGFDLEIVKMAFEAEVFPKIVNFESKHLCPKDLYESRKLLEHYAYSFVDISGDTLAIRKS